VRRQSHCHSESDLDNELRISSPIHDDILGRLNTNDCCNRWHTRGSGALLLQQIMETLPRSLLVWMLEHMPALRRVDLCALCCVARSFKAAVESSPVLLERKRLWCWDSGGGGVASEVWAPLSTATSCEDPEDDELVGTQPRVIRLGIPVSSLREGTAVHIRIGISPTEEPLPEYFCLGVTSKRPGHLNDAGGFALAAFPDGDVWSYGRHAHCDERWPQSGHAAYTAGDVISVAVVNSGSGNPIS